MGSRPGAILRLKKTPPAPRFRVRESSDALPANEQRGHRSLRRGVRQIPSSYSATISPDPPSSAGKSFSLGSPSRIGSTVSE